jgi:uncharacterized protein (DUF885 family)
MINESEASSLAFRIADEAWEEVRRNSMDRAQVDRLPLISPEESHRRSRLGATLLERIAHLKGAPLAHDADVVLRVAEFRAGMWAQESDRYWLAVDPLGVGFFGMFLPTAYCGGFLLNYIHSQFAGFKFEEAGDCDRYLGLLADYSRLIGQFETRTRGQRERGILMPRPQIAAARRLLDGFRARAGSLAVACERSTKVGVSGFVEEVARRCKGPIDKAYESLISVFTEDYVLQAPETVGMGQYTNGEALYLKLVKEHTTLDLSPREVHARGLERMASLQESMRKIRDELTFDGDHKAFVAYLNRDPRWRADTVEGVASVFQCYIDRLAPRYREYFSSEPKAGYTIAPLPTASQDSMTFGYYDAPRPGKDQGVYYFNARNLTQQALHNIGALTYHELVPGHHLHFATQHENRRLHPLLAHNAINAYNEGWAEYAATFAEEIGMYEEPQERYGRLVQEAFLTSRLVVDTGMNVLGWSLERARDYMRQYSGMAETEVLTETLRYSCDLPAQSLAYKLGDTEILNMRNHMRTALGTKFRLREFHDAVLEYGALPLPDLAWHVDWRAQQVAELHP